MGRITSLMLIVAVLCLFVACSRRGQRVPTGPQTSATPRVSAVADTAWAQAGAATAAFAHTTGKGLLTNLVYSGDFEQQLARETRSPEEILAALEEDPGNPNLLFALGYCYLKKCQDVPLADPGGVFVLELEGEVPAGHAAGFEHPQDGLAVLLGDDRPARIGGGLGDGLRASVKGELFGHVVFRLPVVVGVCPPSAAQRISPSPPWHLRAN